MKLSRRRMDGVALIVFSTLLVCVTAEAAPIFTDDFESGAVLSSSGGKWDRRFVRSTNSADENAAAARRGAFGFRMVDGDGSSGARVEAQLEKSVPTNRSAYYSRFWFRMSQNASGHLIVHQHCSSSCNEGYGDVYLESDRTIGASGASGSSYSYTRSSPAFRLATGTWYLIEAAATGLGTSSGRRRVWVNGQLVSDVTGVNLSNKSVGLIVLGQPWTEAGTFRGNLDFDDIYVDDKPLPSHFSLEGPASLETGACVPVTVSMRDSVSRALAPAPYNVSGIALAIGGNTNAALYSDSACTSAVSTVNFNVDSTSRTLYLRATVAGTAQVTVGTAADDFLPGQRSFTVVQGAPPPEPNGTSCSLNSQCASGFCVDGVCCDSACNAGSCDACSIAQGALTNGVCRLLPLGTVCREATGDCDAEEVCSGNSGVCPADALSPSGTLCRGAAGQCDVEERCTGTSAACPANAYAPSTLVCREPTATTSIVFCTGNNASCPEASPVPGGGAGTGGGSGNGGGADPLIEEPPFSEEPSPAVPDEENGSGAAPDDCPADSCVEPADLGFSCASTDGAGLAALLGSILPLLWARQHRRRRPR